MSQHRQNIFWIPLILSAAFFLLAPALETFHIKPTRAVSIIFLVVAVLLVVLAGLLTYRQRGAHQSGISAQGGTGGTADVTGQRSQAVGGGGGDAIAGKGGDGGNATVKGNDSVAKGGRGGNT